MSGTRFILGRDKSLVADAESKDCGVHALAYVCDVPYAAAWTALAMVGRKPGNGTYDYQMQAAARALGYAVDMKLGQGRAIRCTVMRLPDHVPPRGAYLVEVTGHFVAVRDGVVRDSNGKLRARCIRYWPVTLL